MLLLVLGSFDFWTGFFSHLRFDLYGGVLSSSLGYVWSHFGVPPAFVVFLNYGAIVSHIAFFVK